MRVFTGGIATETNTFAPMPTGLASFRDRGYYPAGTHPDTMSFFAGPLWAARERGRAKGWTVVEGLVAAAQPSGTTTRFAYETLREELLRDLAAALPVDMVVLGLHGAMVAQGYDDCEGDLLARVRATVGPDVVIGAELDPHNHLTPQMLANADLLIAFKEYPHTDVLERAYELVDLCAAQVERKVRLAGAAVDCGMIATLHTSREPARGFVDRIQAMEGKNGILSISITHGFAWGDVEHMGTQVLVYADGDRAKAEATARTLADELVGLREQLAMRFPGIDEALDEALAFDGGPVVLADGADNPGGGASGDSTFILRRLLERGIRRVALGPLWDPVAARIAFEAGEGAHLPLRIGGKVGPLSGDPVDAMCTVRKAIADMKMTGLAGTPMDMGDSVLVETEGIEIVLASLRNQAMGTDLFTQLGCDLAEKKIVVVKSSQHFHAAFSKVAKHVIYVGAPGAVTLDLNTLPYRKVRRPKWPLQ
ncbi:MAG TPA: M81 family metallopeptidase [Caldimonas sp.]|nr:M81 family metallopeptidase [Caldimonas sp.]